MFLAVVNNAALSTGVHESFQISVFIFCRLYSGVGLLDHVFGSSIFSFLRPFHRGCIVLHSHQQWIYCVSFFSVLASVFKLFDDSHSGRCEVISHCGFTCLSLMISDGQHLFICHCTSLYVSLYRCWYWLPFSYVSILLTTVLSLFGVGFFPEK